MYLGSHELGLEEAAIGREWLLTNGLGGFASSTVAGLNTRRYHGWLVPQVARCGGRFVVLATVEEEIHLGGVSRPGCRHLQGFALDPLPVFTYGLGGLFLERLMVMPRGQNRIVAVYRFSGLLEAGAEVDIVLRPLITFRFYHHLMRATDWPFRIETGPGWVSVQPHDDAPTLVLRFAPGGDVWRAEGGWRRGVEYAEEQRRGLDYVEDLYCPGQFQWRGLDPREGVAFSAALAEDAEEAARLREAPFGVREALRWRAREIARLEAVAGKGRRAVAARAIADPRSPSAKAFLSRLLLAADSFVIANPRTTVIAGFPWFEDWGRDTLIAFTGLFLVTGRFEEAFRVLAGYASFVREGLVPNRFPDQASDPDYGAADAGLWFFHAVQAYLAYTGHLGQVRDTLLGPLREIAEGYAGGTRLGIGIGPDGLLHAGEPGRAVTWMDAKLGDWVVTPRRGYPVELNALWYNALRFLAELEERLSGGGRASGPWSELAARVKSAFGARFWNPARGYLYDVLGEAGSGATGGRGTAGGDASSEETADASLRPNQILAVALPHPVLDRAHWRPVVRACLEELYTPYGLRTLAPSDPAYRGLYRGGPAERDGAYHQGTVWPWLLGPFITALRRTEDRSPASRLLAARMILPFEHHLREAGIGHISEVFDGDHPHLPGGCVAQAWSLAEILRVYVEEVLDIRPPGVG